MDLPAVFARTYEVSDYEDFIDYGEPPPEPSLSGEEMDWLTTLLAEQGARAGNG